MGARRDDLEPLQQALGYSFGDQATLLQALTHSSYAHEHPEIGDGTNERFEFLGDSIFHFVAADELFRTYADAPEGPLTRLRAALVCTASLAEIGEQLRLADYLRVSRGEATINGRGRQSILADTLEAVVAAVYLDGGLEPAHTLVQRLLRPRLASAAAGQQDANAKGRLQEMIQASDGVTPFYRVVERTGPIHEEHFVVEVVAGEHVLARGEGIGKRQAEQHAARAALQRLDTPNTPSPQAPA